MNSDTSGPPEPQNDLFGDVTISKIKANKNSPITRTSDPLNDTIELVNPVHPMKPNFASRIAASITKYCHRCKQNNHDTGECRNIDECPCSVCKRFRHETSGNKTSMSGINKRKR